MLQEAAEIQRVPQQGEKHADPARGPAMYRLLHAASFCSAANRHYTSHQSQSE
jgi:hypothetical protein